MTSNKNLERPLASKVTLIAGENSITYTSSMGICQPIECTILDKVLNHANVIRVSVACMGIARFTEPEQPVKRKARHEPYVVRDPLNIRRLFADHAMPRHCRGSRMRKCNVCFCIKPS